VETFDKNFPEETSSQITDTKCLATDAFSMEELF
jgi:hypothetical protein